MEIDDHILRKSHVPLEIVVNSSDIGYHILGMVFELSKRYLLLLVLYEQEPVEDINSYAHKEYRWVVLFHYDGKFRQTGCQRIFSCHSSSPFGIKNPAENACALEYKRKHKFRRNLNFIDVSAQK